MLTNHRKLFNVSCDLFQIITTSAEQNPELFKAAQVSIGMLGIITEVTFQCVEKFNVEETRMPYPLDYCLENMDEIAKSADHVKLWVDIHFRRCAVIQVNRTQEEPRDQPNLISANLEVCMGECNRSFTIEFKHIRRNVQLL